jgi:hypothetical protein
LPGKAWANAAQESAEKEKSNERLWLVEMDGVYMPSSGKDAQTSSKP